MGLLTMKKRPSKRRVIARFNAGRLVHEIDILRHNLFGRLQSTGAVFLFSDNAQTVKLVPPVSNNPFGRNLTHSERDEIDRICGDMW